jgi:hypothetical protein
MSASNIRSAWVLIGMIGALPSCVVTTPAPTQQSGSDEDAGGDNTGNDNGDEAGAGDDAACEQSGASACNDILRGVCAVIVTCCSSSNASCESWTSDISTCMGYWIGVGYDCSSAQYVSTPVCPDETKSCANDVSSLTCSSVYANTLQWSESCIEFWGQFE